jgi:multiple sugar transport system substrate-binding protein
VYDFPQYEGKYTAWSSGNSPRMLYVNKTLFQNGGVQAPLFDKYDAPGWTWDDFVAAAQKITKDPDGQRPTFAVDMWDTGIEQTLLVSSGVDEGIYSKDGKQFLMASPKGIEAMQALADLACRYKVSRPNTFADSASTLFQQGRLGMLFATMGSTTTFRRNVKDFDWDVAPFPKRQARLVEGSLVVYCIPKDAKNPDAGWQFLNYMTSDEAGKVFGETLFYIPVRKTAASQYVKVPAGEKPERLKLFVEAMNYNRAINFTNNTERARQIYRPELTKAFRCEETAKTALENVKKQVEDSLVGAV